MTNQLILIACCVMALCSTAAAVQVLESINTDTAKRLLLSYDLQQGNYNALAQHLSQLPEVTLNQQYFKQLTLNAARTARLL